MDFHRRRAEREPAHWQARYFIEHREDLGWRDCQVLDISLVGAALQLVGARHAETAATRLVLELETVEGEGGIHLWARVRNSEDTDDGDIHVGIEFVEMSPLEREVLELLLARVSY